MSWPSVGGYKVFLSGCDPDLLYYINPPLVAESLVPAVEILSGFSGEVVLDNVLEPLMNRPVLPQLEGFEIPVAAIFNNDTHRSAAWSLMNRKV